MNTVNPGNFKNLNMSENSSSFSRRKFVAAVAAAGAAPQPARPSRGPSVAGAQHGGQLRDEHELAELRRRIHDVIPVTDGTQEIKYLPVGDVGSTKIIR